MHLLPRDAPAAVVAAALDAFRARSMLAHAALSRLPRSWSLTTAWPRAHCRDTDTLFITANLNAGGAQRSLVNLAGPLARRHRIAVAVCAESTQPVFARALEAAGVRTFRPASAADPCTLAPWISTASPAFMPLLTIRASCMVCKASIVTAACSSPSPAGAGSTRPQSVTAYSA